jgi:hypothetical protein
MDEDLRNGLRWVLLTTEDTWVDELDRVLAEHASSLGTLSDIANMLEGSMANAAPQYAARLEAMIGAVRSRLTNDAGDDQEFELLAARYAAVDDEVARLDALLHERRQALAEIEQRLLPHVRDRVEVGLYSFERIEAAPSLVIDDPRAVPPGLCRPAPDAEAVRRAWKQTGKAPFGTRVVHSPARLEVIRTG